MRVPLEWLQEYCRPPLETAELARRLTMTGTKVEAIEHHGAGEPDKFVVGRVASVERHPNADRLSVCVVEVGTGGPAQIVCGAPNVAAGQTVAVARPGAVMPGGTELRAAKLRGVESQGMILAEDELAIGTDHEGILVLDGDGLTPGMALRDVLPIATDVLDLEITSNRPDCLAIYGVAREAHAATGAPLAPPPWTGDPGSAGDLSGVRVSVECPELCPRFTVRLFEDVKLGPSPPWLKARLMAAGQRPISNVVDITNYVMLLTGQPLHAFDLGRVAGQSLTVRRATAQEEVRTLDGQIRVLDDQMVLIADAAGPTSIAGVMGGESSEVSESTTRVLMEAATWDGPNIHRTSWKLGLQTAASLRFEKQLQPEQAMEAQAVATRLMIDLCGARLVPGTVDVGGEGPPPATIHLRERRVAGLLGRAIGRRRCAELLEALQFTSYEEDDGLDVQPPFFRRGDVTREVDVIEEVARLDGLEKLPATLPARHGVYGGLTPRQRLRRRVSDALTAQGLDEATGWSFTSPAIDARLRLAAQPAVRLENPLSSEQSRLRTELLSSLLDVARHNRARGAGVVRLFEVGAVYLPQDGAPLPREPQHLAAVMIGPVRRATWREQTPPRADLFAAKGVLAGLLDAIHVSWSVEPTQEPFLHPGKAARISIQDRSAGWLGEIHPEVAAQWDLDEPVAAFELDLDALPDPGTIVYEDVLTFPEVREDLAVVVAENVSAAEVIAVVRRTGSPLLRSVGVFDVYRNPETIGEGNVSLALRLSYRAPDRTLTDAEVARKRNEIVDALAGELGGRIRAA